MSLTSLLKSDKVLRGELRRRFPIPSAELQGAMIAPPISTNYALVGTATDYLVRSWLQWLNGTRVEPSRSVVADHAMAMFEIYLSKRFGRAIGAGARLEHTFDAKHLLGHIRRSFGIAKERLEEFSQRGRVTDDVIASALFLARMDPFYRALVVDPGFLSDRR